ncbi:hypothetical protein [Clostridium sp. B9]|uniref:hypothetical protein n=1 Tax=Clostridium sp. B9 TaxID=3423224 RepID=UPI003D2EB602
MGKIAFLKRKKAEVYEFEYSDQIRELCKFYMITTNIAWILVLFALVKPVIVLPSFIISLILFTTNKMKVSWRVSAFLEKIRNGQVDDASMFLNKLKGKVDREVYEELKVILSKRKKKLKIK